MFAILFSFEQNKFREILCKSLLDIGEIFHRTALDESLNFRYIKKVFFPYNLPDMCK